MRPSVLVTEYLDKLSCELRFDPQLSRRVRREVEGHLLDAIGDDAGGDPGEAARRAIARFGDPQEIPRGSMRRYRCCNRRGGSAAF
jgi:hypothetical protein